MKTNEIDELIKKIVEEDSELYKDVNDISPMESIMEVFKGKMKWINRMSILIMFALFTLTIFCAIKFFQVETLRELIGYATGFGLSLMMIGFLKMFQFLQIDRNVLLREFKKHELRLLSGE